MWSLKQKWKIRNRDWKKLTSDLNMHYNIIKDFAHSSQYPVGHPSDSIGSAKYALMKDIIVQQAPRKYAEEAITQPVIGMKEGGEGMLISSSLVSTTFPQ